MMGMRQHTWNPRPVTVRDTLAVLISFVAMLVAMILVALAQRGYTMITDRPAPTWLGIALGVTAMGTQAGVLAALLRRRGWRWADLGFARLSCRGWHLLWQIPTVMIVSLILILLVAALLPDLTPADTAPTDAAARASGQAWMLTALLLYLIVGPVIEEVVFRRLLMGWPDRTVGVVLSTLTTSVLFGLIHLVPPVMIWTGLIGLGCALLVRWHRSLWAGLALHMVNNLMASAGLIAALLT